MKRRNPIWGCLRIAQQITLAIANPTTKDVVRRILAVAYQPEPGSSGPSWLTVLGHAKERCLEMRTIRPGHFALLKGGNLHGIMNATDEDTNLFMCGKYD